MRKIKNNLQCIIVVVLGILANTTVMAGFGGPNVHSHGDVRVYNHGGYGYYDRGGYYYGRQRTIIAPNVIINVPAPRYYPRVCEDVEVCDNYTGQCWLDRYCD